MNNTHFLEQNVPAGSGESARALGLLELCAWSLHPPVLKRTQRDEEDKIMDCEEVRRLLGELPPVTKHRYHDNESFSRTKLSIGNMETGTE